MTTEELRAGGRALERSVRRYAPRLVAVLGLGAYRVALARPKAKIGPQEDLVGGIPTWVLPNPSGRMAAYQAGALTELFTRVREAAGLPDLTRSRRPARRRR